MGRRGLERLSWISWRWDLRCFFFFFLVLGDTAFHLHKAMLVYELGFYFIRAVIHDGLVWSTSTRITLDDKARIMRASSMKTLDFACRDAAPIAQAVRDQPYL